MLFFDLLNQFWSSVDQVLAPYIGPPGNIFVLLVCLSQVYFCWQQYQVQKHIASIEEGTVKALAVKEEQIAAIQLFCKEMQSDVHAAHKKGDVLMELTKDMQIVEEEQEGRLIAIEEKLRKQPRTRDDD